MSRYSGVVVAWLVLILIYALSLGSLSPPDLALGALLGGLVLFGFRRLLLPTSPQLTPVRVVARALGLVPLALVIAREVSVGTLKVALAVLGVRRPRASGVVAVPMDERSPTGVAASSILISLTPGEVVLDLDWGRRLILVHTIDAGDPEALRRRQRALYERYQRRAFP